jgi:hypothetical protein
MSYLALASANNTVNAYDKSDSPSDRPAVIAKSQGTGTDRRIEMVPVTRLAASKGNARIHSKKQIRQIADSIKRFGFNNPVLVDDGGTIIAGHGRVEAAKLLGINEVPTLRLSHLSATEQRAYVLADNRLAEKARWNREVLAVELKALIDLDFELGLTRHWRDQHHPRSCRTARERARGSRSP